MQKPNKAGWQQRDPAVYYVLNAAWHVQEAGKKAFQVVFNRKAALKPEAVVEQAPPAAPGAAFFQK